MQRADLLFFIWVRREKTCLWWFANNKGADQPAHPHSLIIAFVIRVLVSIISRFAMSKISIFWLVSVGEKNGLSLSLSETPETVFLATRRRGPIYVGIDAFITRDWWLRLLILYIRKRIRLHQRLVGVGLCG